MNFLVSGITTLSSTTSSSAADGLTELVSTDTIKETASILDQYGPTIVIVSVFILLFIGIVVFILRINNKMNQQMIQSQQAAIEANHKMTEEMFNTCMAMIRPKQEDEKDDDDDSDEKPKKKKNIVSIYIDSSLAFKDASRIAMSKIKCERIAIYLFHNGNHTPYGYPFAKMSCVHEWNVRGSNTVRGANHVNIPLYAFSTIVESLVKDGEFVVGNIYEHGILSADEQVFQFISGSTIRALFALGIVDKNNELAAFTIAEFKEAKDFSSHETYTNVKDALVTMNSNIYSIIINDEFRESYSEKSEDSK